MGNLVKSTIQEWEKGATTNPTSESTNEVMTARKKGNPFLESLNQRSDDIFAENISSLKKYKEKRIISSGISLKVAKALCRS